MKLVGRVGLNISASDLNHKHFSVCLQKVTCSLHKGSDALFITLIFLTQYEKVLCAVRRPVHVLSLRPSVLLFWIMVRGPVYPEWPSAHTPPILLVQSVLLSLLWGFLFFCVCVVQFFGGQCASNNWVETFRKLISGCVLSRGRRSEQQSVHYSLCRSVYMFNLIIRSYFGLHVYPVCICFNHPGLHWLLKLWKNINMNMKYMYNCNY